MFSDYFVGVVQDLNLNTQDQALNIDVDNNFNNKRFSNNILFKNQ